MDFLERITRAPKLTLRFRILIDWWRLYLFTTIPFLIFASDDFAGLSWSAVIHKMSILGWYSGVSYQHGLRMSVQSFQIHDLCLYQNNISNHFSLKVLPQCIYLIDICPKLIDAAKSLSSWTTIHPQWILYTSCTISNACWY